MHDSIKVWVRKRKIKKGLSYHLRFISPLSNRWVSKGVGTDRKRADREAALLESKLNNGTYSETRRISWNEFVTGQVASIPGKRHRVACKHVLKAFGSECKPLSPCRVTFAMIEGFVATLRERKLSVSSINTKLRYLRLSFNKAIKRGYMAKNPLDGWIWDKPNIKEPRTVSHAEEVALLKTAKLLYGHQYRTFVVAALATGARRGELLKLSWHDVDFKGESVLFTMTKGKKDRRVPVEKPLLRDLRKLQAKTLQQGGPFVGLSDNIHFKWKRIRKEADCADVKIHDLRRTYCSRLIRAGVPLKTVQRLSGHASLETLLTYYNEVSEDDLRNAVKKLSASCG